MIVRKIRCPRHYILKPGRKPYVMEINPRLKNLPRWVFEKSDWQGGKISRYRPKKDIYGRPIIDRTSYYQPLITGAFAIEHIYDPTHDICRHCDKRCKEGLGIVNELAIKRLRRG